MNLFSYQLQSTVGYTVVYGGADVPLAQQGEIETFDRPRNASTVLDPSPFAYNITEGQLEALSVNSQNVSEETLTLCNRKRRRLPHKVCRFCARAYSSIVTPRNPRKKALGFTPRLQNFLAQSKFPVDALVALCIQYRKWLLPFS